MTGVLTIDHPGWLSENDGVVRAVATASGVFVLTWAHGELSVECVRGAEDSKPRLVAADPEDLPHAAPAVLRAGLARLGVTRRLANPWLWDAIVTAVLRQVVRAEQARKLYRAWCTEMGTPVPGRESGLALTPDPRRVLAMDMEQFAKVGARFHRTALQAAAGAYLNHHTAWEQMRADELAAALTGIPRIGPWTAGAAAADFTGDFSVYPHDDLAVRTWAARIAPDYPWPAAKDKRFRPLWSGWAGNDRTALHTLTLSTLTWGSHIR